MELTIDQAFDVLSASEKSNGPVTLKERCEQLFPNDSWEEIHSMLTAGAIVLVQSQIEYAMARIERGEDAPDVEEVMSNLTIEGIIRGVELGRVFGLAEADSLPDIR